MTYESELSKDTEILRKLREHLKEECKELLRSLIDINYKVVKYVAPRYTVEMARVKLVVELTQQGEDDWDVHFTEEVMNRIAAFLGGIYELQIVTANKAVFRRYLGQAKEYYHYLTKRKIL